MKGATIEDMSNNLNQTARGWGNEPILDTKVWTLGR